MKPAPHPRATLPTHLQRERTRIAQEAARLISEHGIGDLRHAIGKAAARLGCTDARAFPREAEVDAALREHQRLFHAGSQPRALRERREAALEAMQFLHAFDPRLVGAVLDGTADEHSTVCLHVFADDADAVGHFLRDQRIPARTASRRLRIGQGAETSYEVLRFEADGIAFDLTVLPLRALHQPPRRDADEHPLERAALPRVRALLGTDDEAARGAAIGSPC